MTSAAQSIRIVPRDRASARTLAALLAGYGAIGVLVSAALGVSLAPALSAMDALARSSSDIERTLATTRDAFDTFGSSLVEGKRSAQQAAVTARSSAATARQLADAMGISIFGAQPLAGLAGGFRQQATDIVGLADDLDALGSALANDERDVRAVRDRVSDLHDRVVLLSATRASSIPVAPVLYLLILWIAAQSVAALWLGYSLWRR